MSDNLLLFEHIAYFEIFHNFLYFCHEWYCNGYLSASVRPNLKIHLLI